MRRGLPGANAAYGKDIRSKLFRADGPLGSFGPRIHLAYLQGYLSEQGHSDLTEIKDIRNRFAHFAEHNSFDSEAISGRCQKLQLLQDRVTEQIQILPGGDATKAVKQDALVIQDGAPYLAIGKASEDEKSPKWRFTVTAKLFCAALDYYLQHPKSLRLPLL